MKAITEQLCGIEISSSHVSRATAQLDEVLEAWRNRPLGEYVYLYLDARYEKVRQDGQVRDAAVLIAAGVNWDGKREILGVSVALGEQEVHWRTFLQSLVQRGLQGVRLIISDAHAGLRAARQAVFGGIPWQRCQFHLQQHKLMCPERACRAKWLMTSVRSSMHPIELQPKPGWPRLSRSMSLQLLVWQTGWKPISRKD